jgi:hypothetical protein
VVHDMIHAEPLSIPLGDEYRPQGHVAMRSANVAILAVEKCWDTLRHYKPEHWHDVLIDLRNQPNTSRWFGRS